MVWTTIGTIGRTGQSGPSGSKTEKGFPGGSISGHICSKGSMGQSGSNKPLKIRKK